MPALRHFGPNTGASVSTITALLADAHTTKITFFATATKATPDYDQKTDGPETNLPLVAALAEYTIPGFGPVSLVFDGLFLTRARHPRSTEVDHVLAAAVSSGKARFSPHPVRFTSTMPVEEAAQFLSSVPNFPLDQNSLAAYTRLLGGV